MTRQLAVFSFSRSRSRCACLFAFLAGFAFLMVAAASDAHAAIPSCNLSTLQAAAPPGLTIGDIPNLGQRLTTTNGVADEPAGVLSPDSPPFCLVTGTIVTDPATSKTVNFGAMLPDPSSWNRRFMFQGCGYNCGEVFFVSLPSPLLQKGYPLWATDDGHTGLLFTNASWPTVMPGVPNPDTIDDFAYRAVHTVTVVGKQFTANYYSTPRISHAYWTGCSDGGREAFDEATRYPDDYDGILGGAPYFDVPGEALNLADVTAQFRTANPGALLTPAQFTLATQIVTQKCDAADGVTDGLIQNPAVCRFNAQTDLPRCTGAPSASCFTQDQINSLENVMSGATDRAGRVVHAGFPLSSQVGSWVSSSTAPSNFTGPEPWPNFVGAPEGWQWADPTVQYLAYWGIPGYNSLITPRFSYQAGGPGSIDAFHTIVSDETIATMFGRMNVAAGDFIDRIRPFLKRGGKFILYHGLSDGLITPYGTIQYYRGLAQSVGGYDRLQDNMRLFLVPGMSHCLGGDGATNFGQDRVMANNTDPQHDAVSALEQWVEKGIPPAQFIATKFTNDDPTQAATRTFPLCVFPAQARYSGSGDVNDAGNWRCPEHDTSGLEIGPNGDQAGLSAPLFTDQPSSGDRN